MVGIREENAEEKTGRKKKIPKTFFLISRKKTKAEADAFSPRRFQYSFRSLVTLKARIIELPPGGEMPTCEMESYVIFFVVNGAAQVSVNEETANLETGQCLITEPATLSMKTKDGVKIMGVQIGKC